MISAKTGLGVPDVLEAIVTRLPPPKGDRTATLKALLVDSWYDVYLGVVVLIRVVDGTMKKGQRIRMMGTNAAYDVERVGFFTPKMEQVDELGPGEIGFITAAIKEVADTRVGDTITERWANCASTTRASPTRWKPRPRSASASAAAFSGCCIWKSSRSGCRANSTSI
jgi:GTP-binding protein LepA